MATTGRPAIGNYHHIPLGELDPLIRQWAENHNETFNQAARHLINEGLAHRSSEERILIDTTTSERTPNNSDRNRTLEAFDSAPEEHKEELRFSESRSERTRGLDGAGLVHEVSVVRFPDPTTNDVRYIVDEVGFPNDRIVYDYTSQQAAERRYEETMREASRGIAFTVTDVDGVPEHSPDDIDE